MGTEIERKFLVASHDWRAVADAGTAMKQGYLAIGPPAAVRVRLEGNQAFLNIKQSTLDISRAEFEYPLPAADAEELLETLCAGRTVEKTRYCVEYGGRTWEVDVFKGLNAPLIVAEVELESTADAIELPPWAGAEVSGDPRYLNTYLSQHPFSTWET